MSENRELLAWTASVLSREMGNHTTGEVRVQIHEGTIQRVRVERTERPPNSGQQGK